MDPSPLHVASSSCERLRCGNLRRDSNAQWTEIEMLQNACINLHFQNEKLGAVCSNLSFQNHALWTRSEKRRKECQKLRRDSEKLSKKLRIQEEQLFQTKHCSNMMCVHSPGALRADMVEVHEGNSSLARMTGTKRESRDSMDSVGAHERGSAAEQVQAGESSPASPAQPVARHDASWRPDDLPAPAVKPPDKPVHDRRYSWDCASLSTYADPDALDSDGEASTASQSQDIPSPQAMRCLDSKDDEERPLSLPRAAVMSRTWVHPLLPMTPMHASKDEPKKLPRKVVRSEQLRRRNMTLAQHLAILQEMSGDEDPESLQGTQCAKDDSQMRMNCRATDAGSLDPSCLILPSLLPYLTVDDILEWRVTSRQTRSPRVLLRHIAEMGRLDRSESIVDFSTKIELACVHGDTFDADVCGNDPEQIKYYDCQWWCMRLARARETHFAESDAFEIVCPNLRDLLRHCADEDASVRSSAHHVVRFYGKGGLPFVRQMIADAMLTLMGHVLADSTGISQAALMQVMQCTRHLDKVVRALAKPQRQKWVSLLVKALESLRSQESHRESMLTLISDLKLLWRADDDPSRTYAEAEQQLKALKKQANKDVRVALWDLLCC
ncbi:unnamed protein product [Symbiodinium sp. CCMP2592]|nr:unnamed protein product [Symbiodinium sp. CCMP2592]